MLCAVVFLTALRVGAMDAIPISLHDGLLWARVSAHGAPLNFVIDTGAASSCLDLATARRLRLASGAPVSVTGVDGRVTGFYCRNFTASAGPLSLPPNPIALDLSAPSMACSQRIDGLIGADFFKGRVVRLDYAHHLLSLGAPLAARAGTALRFADGVICVRVSVNGASYRWTRLDTGCTDALVWCAGERRPRAAGPKSLALSATTGNSTHADVAVGTTRIPAVPTTYRSRNIFPGESGLLGNATLSRFEVTIDGVRNRLRLELPAE